MGAEVGVGGEGAALSGLEVHDVFSTGFGGVGIGVRGEDATALQAAGLLVGFVEEGEGDSEAGVGGFGTADGLEEEVEGCALIHGLHLGGEVGEDAGLGGDAEAAAGGVGEGSESRACGGGGGGGG